MLRNQGFGTYLVTYVTYTLFNYFSFQFLTNYKIHNFWNINFKFRYVILGAIVRVAVYFFFKLDQGGPNYRTPNFHRFKLMSGCYLLKSFL